MSRRFRLAQINVARMLAPLDSPVMAGFVAELDRINALADAAPGFVWRLQGPGGDATSLPAFDDPTILVNLSVWETFEALHTYVYRSAHARVMQERRRWFGKYQGPYYALWWIAADHRPSVSEGQERIRVLAERGASAEAFWFGHPFAAPDESEQTAGR
jgi:hypothetical protein